MDHSIYETGTIAGTVITWGTADAYPITGVASYGERIHPIRPEKIKCEYCGTSNDSSLTNCINCTAVL